QESPHGIALTTPETTTVLGQLGRQRDAWYEAIRGRLDAHGRVLMELTGERCFADGAGVARGETRDFGSLVEKFTSTSRAPCGASVMAAATQDPRIGFVQLLDPDGEALAGQSELPEGWAAFLLAPIGGYTALEITAGPAAATYLFAAPVDEVNRDLQLLHFR